jgi:hypothetical protein
MALLKWRSAAYWWHSRRYSFTGGLGEFRTCSAFKLSCKKTAKMIGIDFRWDTIPIQQSLQDSQCKDTAIEAISLLRTFLPNVST